MLELFSKKVNIAYLFERRMQLLVMDFQPLLEMTITGLHSMMKVKPIADDI